LVALPTLQLLTCTLVGLLGGVLTELARAGDLVTDVSGADEGCPLGLAPMASATAATVVGDAIASALMAAKGFTRRDFTSVHPAKTLGRRLLLTAAADSMHTDAEVPLLLPDATVEAAVVAMESSHRKLSFLPVINDQRHVVGVVRCTILSVPKTRYS
jgi:arabinose-5-phosphate isomerase